MNGLTMVIEGGMFLAGRMDGGKLLEPRMFGTKEVGPDQFQFFMRPLPGAPMFVSLPKDILYYPITDKQIEALYVKATSGLELVQ
jgi:hypothetical protein